MRSKPELESCFLDAQTGFPWIDAIIMQCHNEGWTHYVARKSLAIFLTRSYLWISWVFGKEFFQDVMLDFEMSVSCVCWMQDSCSGFFSDTIESLDSINPVVDMCTQLQEKLCCTRIEATMSALEDTYGD